jgi:hypothetical protein
MNTTRLLRYRLAFVEAGRRLLTIASFGVLSCCLPACGMRSTPSGPSDILLFNGTGTSPNDVAAFERILNEHHFHYGTANSRQLNGMDESRLRAYRLLIIPGGNYEKIGNGLSSTTPATVRTAVLGGLNYLGVCAGALLAGDSPHNGLNLTSGVRFPFYALVNRGVHKSAVEIDIAGVPPQAHYWEDGPQLTGWGDVVAKYPDGTPAVVEGRVGSGWVILSGVHPEAPESWRRGMNFATPADVDNAYAATLIGAALNGTRLDHH